MTSTSAGISRATFLRALHASQGFLDRAIEASVTGRTAQFYLLDGTVLAYPTLTVT